MINLPPRKDPLFAIFTEQLYRTQDPLEAVPVVSPQLRKLEIRLSLCTIT